MPLLAALLGIPLGDRHAMPPLTSDAQQGRTLEALARPARGSGAQQAGAGGWSRTRIGSIPTTLELIDLCLERIRDLPVFVADHVPAGVRRRAGRHMPHVTR